MAGTVATGSGCVYGRRNHSRLHTSDRRNPIGPAIEPRGLRSRRRMLESCPRRCIIGEMAGRVSFKDTGVRRRLRRRGGVPTGTMPHRALSPTASDSANRFGRGPSVGREHGKRSALRPPAVPAGSARGAGARMGMRRPTGARVRRACNQPGVPPARPAQSPHRVLDKIMCRRCERMHFQPTGYRMVEMRCKNCSVQIEEAKQDHARHGENISLSMSFMVSSLTGSSPVTCVLIARNVAMAAFLRS